MRVLCHRERARTIGLTMRVVRRPVYSASARGRADSICGRACLGNPDLFRELAVVSLGQVVSASSIVGKMVNTGPGPVARKADNRERT